MGAVLYHVQYFPALLPVILVSACFRGTNPAECYYYGSARPVVTDTLKSRTLTFFHLYLVSP
jgi:hypothetical protein